jgi:hypothetical protein
MNVRVTSISISGGLLLLLGGCGHYSMNEHDAMVDGSQTTEGTVVNTSTGGERNYTLTGKGSMVRTPHGQTMVDLHVAGLHANEKYPSHVHNLPCEEKGGGGHYQHEKGAKVDAVNEIWLTFTTNGAGVGYKEASHGHTARSDAQSIVIHDSTTDKARIACINLK